MPRTRGPLPAVLVTLLLAACADPSARQAPPGAADCKPAVPNADEAGFRLQVCGATTERNAGWRRLEDLRTGRSIDLAEPPSRVVSQTLATDEVFSELLTEEQRPRLLAVSAFAASPRYSDLGDFAASIGTTITNKTEEILALNPDLVFAASYSTTETVEQLEGAGVPVVVLHRFDSVDAIRDNLRVIAFALGLDEDGRRLEQAFEAKVDRAAALIRQMVEGERLAVLAYGSGSVHAAGTLMDDLFARFGLRNPAAEAGLQAWPTINEEHLIEWRPDLVLLSAPEGRDARVKALFRSQFPELTATGAAHLVAIPETSWSTVSHRVGDLALQLARGVVEATGAQESTGPAEAPPN